MRASLAVPATLLLVYRAWSRRSLTLFGIVVAAATATIHAIHPWSAFFALLVVFFLGGTSVTKVKHNVKARLTLSSSGSSGGDGPRTHVQVLANSVVASILILAHARQLHLRRIAGAEEEYWPWAGDLLVVGIVSNYAAVAADTFSSELGILSKGSPRLISSLTFRKVPPGTNGGVTPFGLLAGFLGSFTIAATAALLLPFYEADGSAWSTSRPSIAGNEATWGLERRVLFVVGVTVWGGLGSLLDSLLGGLLQASVVDVRTGKIVEGIGGSKVLTQGLGPWSTQFGPVDGQGNQSSSLDSTADATRSRQRPFNPISKRPMSSGTDDGRPASRKIENGLDLLDNNAVNLLMALTMSLGGMSVASWYWNIPLSSIVA